MTISKQKIPARELESHVSDQQVRIHTKLNLHTNMNGLYLISVLERQ